MSIEAQLIRREISFWGVLLLASNATGWWGWALLAVALWCRYWIYRADKALEPQREGFWSRVWNR